MGSCQIEPDKRRGFLLTEQGRRKFRQAFRDVGGHRRSFDSVAGLDHRTVSKVYNGHEPVNLTSLEMCFDSCGIEAEPGDYFEYTPPSVPAHSTAPTTRTTPTPANTTREPGGSLPPGSPRGPVTPGSDLYIARAADAELDAALQRHDSIVLIKGPQQSGKSSLLARGLAEWRLRGERTCFTDLRRLTAEDLRSPDRLYKALCRSLALKWHAADPETLWRSHWPAADNLEAYLCDEILGDDSPRVLWALDDLDRLFECAFREELFTLFRGWHNACAHDPDGPWKRLSLILTYSAEATLLISNLDQSPFNVGTLIELEDLSREEAARLNRLYGSPLQTPAEEEELFALVGGHPYLMRLALHETRTHAGSLGTLMRQALLDGGMYRSYLDRMRRFIVSDREQERQVRAVLQGEPIVPSVESDRSFHMLRSAGVLVGACAQEAAFRCELYRAFLRRHLT